MKFQNLFVAIKKVRNNSCGENENKESDKNETENSNDTDQIQKDEKRLPEMAEKMKRLRESQKKMEIENKLLRNENQNLRKDIIQCKICMDRDKSVYFYPCGHVVMCSDCSKSIQECPICRNKIRKKQPVYLS